MRAGHLGGEHHFAGPDQAKQQIRLVGLARQDVAERERHGERIEDDGPIGYVRPHGSCRQ